MLSLLSAPRIDAKTAHGPKTQQKWNRSCLPSCHTQFDETMHATTYSWRAYVVSGMAWTDSVNWSRHQQIAQTSHAFRIWTVRPYSSPARRHAPPTSSLSAILHRRLAYQLHSIHLPTVTHAVFSHDEPLHGCHSSEYRYTKLWELYSSPSQCWQTSCTGLSTLVSVVTVSNNIILVENKHYVIDWQKRNN